MTKPELENLNRKQLAIIGAAVADAASLGFHWLYDQERIRSLEPESPEFRVHKREDYADVPSYFAHENRTCGQLSHYGEQLKTMLESLSKNGGVYDKSHYQNSFVDHFGYGGTYEGYIDHPTRNTLDNIARADEAELEKGSFFGADDVQLPALSKLPPLIAAYADDKDLNDVVDSAVRVTNDNEVARMHGKFAAALLQIAIQTGDTNKVIDFAKSYGPMESLLKPVFENQNLGTIEATAKWGMSCELKLGVPSIVHNLWTTNSFAEAVRTNIYAGGDSCGRSILLGAILGACYGRDIEKTIPSNWLDKLTDQELFLQNIAFLAE